MNSPLEFFPPRDEMQGEKLAPQVGANGFSVVILGYYLEARVGANQILALVLHASAASPKLAETTLKPKLPGEPVFPPLSTAGLAAAYPRQ